MQAGIQLDGASDHGVSEALYLRDPDENGVELYRDRPKEEWPAHGRRRAVDVHEAAGSGRFAARPRIMISTAAVNSTPMQP